MTMSLEEPPEGRSLIAPAPFLRLEGISKRFPGVVALDDVTIEIRAGVVHALTGENGSGKSTLAKISNGSLQPDGGRILLDGDVVEFRNPAAALAAGIVTISQEVTLATDLSVAENIFLGRVPRGRAGLVSWPTMISDAARVLDRLNMSIDPRTRVSQLSLELQQQVEIARAISMTARLLILDEATSSLSEAAARRLLSVVRELSESGTAVLMITHKMAELYETATAVTVLRDGRHVTSGPIDEIPERKLVSLMVGRELGDYYAKREIAHGKVVLDIKGLQSQNGQLKPTTLQVRAGEIYGVAGLVGSGKAEFGAALGGAIAAEGSVRVDGAPVPLGSPKTARRAGIGFVPDDRKGAALLLNRSVAENLTLAWRDRTSRRGWVLRNVEQSMIAAAIGKYRVRTASPSTIISTLSGGNQQKVVLGRTFELSPRVLVLSEPTRGVDIGAKTEIYQMMQDAAARGAAVVLISSELPELLGVSDRIAVFYRGRIVDEFGRSEMKEGVIADAAVSGRSRDQAGRAAWPTEEEGETPHDC